NSLAIYGVRQQATAAPNAPVLSATALSGSSINLNWTDSTTNPNSATSYSIEESVDGGASFTIIATSPDGSSSIAIGGLLSLTNYMFRIRGLNGQGLSSYSTVVSATTT